MAGSDANLRFIEGLRGDQEDSLATWTLGYECQTPAKMKVPSLSVDYSGSQFPFSASPPFIQTHNTDGFLSGFNIALGCLS